MTLDALSKSVNIEKDLHGGLPVLCAVLPKLKLLPALECLVGVFEWHALIVKHFSGRITRDEARNLTVGEMLDGLPQAERGVWDRSYKQFETAWQIAWPRVERCGCLELDHLKGFVMSREASMLLVIMDAGDEVTCSQALTQWLVTQHNELVEVVAEAIGCPLESVSSRLLGEHNVLSYDSKTLERFLKNHCVSYDSGGKLNFHFEQLEQHLCRELDRPVIKLEVRAFQWLGESFSLAGELEPVVKQRDLSPGVAERLECELALRTTANLCLQKVQMCISFIQKSGGGLKQNVGETLLSDYLSTVLCEHAELLPTTRSEVRLMHLQAFSRMLNRLIEKDPMKRVDPRYQKNLPPELQRKVLDAKRHLPERLSLVLGEFGERYLNKEGRIGEETSFLDVIKEAVTENDFDFDVLQKHLPQELKVKHWASIYKTLNKLIDKDPMSSVDTRCQKNLPPDLQQKVLDVPKQLPSVPGEIGEMYLTKEGRIGEEIP